MSRLTVLMTLLWGLSAFANYGQINQGQCDKIMQGSRAKKENLLKIGEKKRRNKKQREPTVISQ